MKRGISEGNGGLVGEMGGLMGEMDGLVEEMWEWEISS